MTFFRELSKRLPSIVGILLLVYIGALLFAPHPSGWEIIFRESATFVGILFVLAIIGGTLAIVIKLTTRRIRSAINTYTPTGANPSDGGESYSRRKPSVLSKILTGLDQYIIIFWDGSSMVYWYAVASAYETYSMFRVHSYLYAAYSFIVFVIFAIDVMLKLEKQAGFITRLWFGYVTLGWLVLTACVDGSKPDSRPSVVFDVLVFGALAFAGFYGHYRSSAESEGRVGDVIPLKR